jgi:hypothetical protein
VGEIARHRWDVVDPIVRAQLNRYAGSIQVKPIGQERQGDRVKMWVKKGQALNLSSSA